ncbi:M17 family metallopeptidase [Halobacteriovorax sp. HLS]|uniref:leucyl aminopeptidase family protein n=1 Tax=Halobacteriovorax sp. HLS TaxID=2234000 RepID=UPI000FD8843D|nr:leucyl aminopeptidase family protein [Halobacteriovorax sp. HLS]
MNFEAKYNLSKTNSKTNKNTTEVYIYKKSDSKLFINTVSLSKWEAELALKNNLTQLSGSTGPIISVPLSKSNKKELSPSDYAIAREEMGPLIDILLSNNSKEVHIHFLNLEDDSIKGALVGIDLSLYSFTSDQSIGKVKFLKDGKVLTKSLVSKAKEISVAVNQARHLVNLPPNELHPVSYANAVKALYSKSKTLKVSILDEKKLQKENCNLLLSVGMSSNNKPRIVHIKYRPVKAKSKKSIALIGKGITFDSGGLDMKSAAGMRFMKKDMGGSATLVGFTRWLENSSVKVNVDIYLALAENAVSENATRPSDIITARNGMKVEIHNTDAEGRLALADAMDLALELKPEIMIDVATLTGAGKVALGQDIASLFSNDDKLANDLQSVSNEMGDLVWKMPLYLPYYAALKSEFCDVSNSASGPGGAITAALFLEKFVGKTKWAHLDIFGWTSGAKPSLKQLGGSGQGVETLIGYFSKL